MKRKLLVIGALSVALLLGGCSALGSASSSSPGETFEGGGTSSDANNSPGGTLAAHSDGDTGRDVATLVPGAQIVTTGTIALLAEEPTTVADRAVALATSLGGHVDNRTEQTSGDARADLVLRIPSEKVTEAIDGLKELATVDSVSITATDVTAQSSDIAARITALQTSVARLLDLMSKATSTTDLIALESTLSERQADLDSLVAQRTALTDTVAYSAITVSVDTAATAPTVGPGDFWSGLGTGWSSLVTALSGALVAFGVALPWLVALALIAAIVLLVIRLGMRRTRRAEEAQTPS
ncbi:hypothetical protein B7R54_12055 [Subtercola boreus]|uniref:DUF4349 domain-containing protein n=1 Tax=Subtercola boreus TaxID=120213 RepID=A0A3E0VJP9_9MICO|nr:DUF4349 domain-containing protein [Subtercola boreus]RFA09855.1 hypothetical protein B7R54_12055 [Subtercola boreus]TQL53020.1 uncharacterized protein DUF4349 [Subtercola boreus]